MNKDINILKITNYDKFKCIADKCKFTCCEGWDINVDNNTYDKWKRDKKDSEYLLNNVKIKKCNEKTEYFINKEIYEACAFLDGQGLCNIVKSHGEEYLSLTCHTFPRLENVFENKKELSLSCACPEVVEILNNLKGKVEMISEKSIYEEENLLELRIRETLIDIIYEERLSLEERLIIGFEMLLNILENEIYTNEENLLEELEKYSDREYIEEVINVYSEIELNKTDSIEEINYLFLDIIQNYKEVSSFKCILEQISNFAENVEVKSLQNKWSTYKEKFKEYDKLIEKCIISKILSNCVSDDIEEMVLAFQMIILEYLLIRYALFLKYCINEEEINIEEVKDYIVAFSRIIGNNTEAVLDFLSDGFEDTILEIGYLCFIALF
ncbi:flagellin lysine-N-methylase [Clostridium sp. LIBA-8841]|uniref:flagellin lysine-N-methylase n=1 Tax=Clostridium sp. LIBA-8841 TaxID=2987530 RepID=UPI002AC38DD4|nr:flagellin lysine-N-methylase [Clostridium sp. LIBA-8841]MDZ5252155.1 flagellin lysine-N-methylase [Clostridium sp. LIBA-8841]